MENRIFEKNSPLYYFEEFSRIPRGSGNRDGICRYLLDFAKEHGLFSVSDEYGNVIIKKPATRGYEDRPTVILQGHSDMVCAIDEGFDIDMKKEGLSLFRDGDLLGARGTSLGADNGIFMTYALSILADEKLEHPALEMLFTSDEEIGMLGANGLDGSLLEGRLMINLDTDREGEFTVGCAGGVRADISLPVSREDFSAKTYSLSVSGLIGGHSGGEIHKGRANAISVIAKLLSDIPDLRLISLTGGTADNAIPRDAKAEFSTENKPDKESLDKLFSLLTKGEADATLTLTETSSFLTPITAKKTKDILSVITGIHTGVIAMSPYIEGLVESSENIGLVDISDDVFSLAVSVRSSKRGEKESIVSKLEDFAKKFDADLTTRGAYPEWEYKARSHLRDTMGEVYREMTGDEPKIYAIHAGLECGILSSKLEGLDCVSTGPNVSGIHSPRERASISSAERVYKYIIELLKRI